MNTNLQKIKDLLVKSDLTIEDQEQLVGLFSNTKDDRLKDTAKLFLENPEWILKMNQNYKKKKIAIENTDKEMWSEIVSEEEEELKNMEENK